MSRPAGASAGLVAVVVTAALAWPGSNDSAVADSISATSPATCGEAIDVPLSSPHWSSKPASAGTELVTSTPGADTLGTT